MCSCVEQFDKHLEQFNTKLSKAVSFGRSGGDLHCSLIIQTEKINPKQRGKHKVVVPTFCPFCGKKP